LTVADIKIKFLNRKHFYGGYRRKVLWFAVRLTLLRCEMGTDSIKDIEVRFENRNIYLYTFFSGSRNGIADALLCWQKAISECKKRGYKKLLVEQEFPEALSTIDSFDAVEAVSRMEIFDLIIAFVDRSISHKDTNTFVENVAVNRGLWAKVFNNFCDGEAWLISQMPGNSQKKIGDSSE
jgi:hypothetical protein